MRAVSVLLFCSGCVAGPQALSEGRLKQLGTRSFQAPFAEVFDATWLAAEHLGCRVREADAQLGTLRAECVGGRGWAIDVSGRGEEQLVVATPAPTRAGYVLGGPDGEDARWTALEEETRALLQAWKEPPDIAYDTRHDQLRTLAFRLTVPKQWESVDLPTARSVAVVQQKKRAKGLNPTLRMEVARRTPRRGLEESLLAAARRALGVRRRLDFPEPLAKGGAGTTVVRDDGADTRVAWYALEAESEAWAVHLLALCAVPPAAGACEAEWEAVAASVDAPGFTVGAPRDAAGRSH